MLEPQVIDECVCVCRTLRQTRVLTVEDIVAAARPAAESAKYIAEPSHPIIYCFQAMSQWSKPKPGPTADERTKFQDKVPDVISQSGSDSRPCAFISFAKSSGLFQSPV